MSKAAYQHLQEKALAFARDLPPPSFYGHHAALIRRSEDALLNHHLIRKCQSHLDESQLECAHGLCHCEAVARDAGVIMLLEAAERGMNGAETEMLFITAIIAGLLHDIKRREDDHAVRGSIESERILKALGVEERSRTYISYAIRNHEAFKATCDLGDVAGCMVSDALYDADKFRWGPENFCVTLWLMVTSRNTPLESLHRDFKEKMKGIERIKGTFRTGTGRRYGPEFIDKGISIGNAIYDEMTVMLSRG